MNRTLITSARTPLQQRAPFKPLDFYPLLFALPRAAGWLAHWCEELDSTDGAQILSGATHLTRPGQVYKAKCVPESFTSMGDRKQHAEEAFGEHVSSSWSIRRRATALYHANKVNRKM